MSERASPAPSHPAGVRSTAGGGPFSDPNRTMNLRRPLQGAALLALAATASASSLTLTFSHTIDLAPLALNSVGDLTYSLPTAKLWISDGASNGVVHRLNPINGDSLLQVDPAAVPGLNFGPDAIAVPTTINNNDVIVFSSFNESEGGRITFGGALVSDYGTSHGATGADVDDQGNLWIVSGTTSGGGCTLMRLNATSGAVLQSVPVLGTTLRAKDLAFDPHTGACYLLLEDMHLLEVNTSTGAQISSTDVSSFTPGASGIGGGLAFSPHGQLVYLAAASGTTANQIVVLERDYAELVCDGTGAGAVCPCGNAGLAGRGCNNSFNTGGGRITIDGVPSVTFDTAALRVTGLPPSAPCLFFQGTTTFESLPATIDDGLICVTGSVIRLATRAASNGHIDYPTTASDPLLHVRGQIPTTGATRLYQVWYRNAAAFCTPGTSNFTNAIQVRWEP